jgi:hypothetical protein
MVDENGSQAPGPSSGMSRAAALKFVIMAQSPRELRVAGQSLPETQP